MSSDNSNDPYLTKKRNYRHEVGEISEHAQNMIGQLVKLRDLTNPDSDANAAGKDNFAFYALYKLGGVIKELASWAIDHQLGLAIHRKQFLPRGNPTSRSLPAYQEAKREVDDHRHEIAAVEYHRHERTVSVEDKRRAMANILSVMNNSFPGDIAEELADALRALEYGEVMPILEPKRSGRKVSFTEQREQLRAVTFARFRRKTGLMSAGDAWNEVAKAFGVSLETLRTWEKRLRESEGDPDGHYRLSTPSFCGRCSLACRGSQNKGSIARSFNADTTRTLW
ncbi:hypothetical protein ACQZ4Y_13385 [Rhizobium sp. L80/93]|uniref:hypothetical protein n=1 Tax=Rhizobium sp. E27B/91 TaxID=2819995 RepID=UPI001ADD54C1|nr:hypothetical protein [Rhizobium sp. E27B/91]MBO9186241.1 hypothetical protein [Rhizobium sp. E27B/91]